MLIGPLLAALLAVADAEATLQPLPPPDQVTIEILRGDFLRRSGSDTIYFANDGSSLDAQSQAILAAQAQWLRLHPEVTVRIEGHTDQRETRSRALAVGERRADAVRDYLVMQGVPAAQISIISWGKERPKVDGLSPGAIAYNRRAVTVIARR